MPQAEAVDEARVVDAAAVVLDNDALLLIVERDAHDALSLVSIGSFHGVIDQLGKSGDL